MTYGTMALQGVGTAMQTFGAMYKGQSDAYNARVESEAKARSADAQAEADFFNAKVYQQLAESETDRATAEAIDYRRGQSANIANLKAKQAAGGFALTGSPLMINETMFQEVEFSTNRIAYAGQLARTRLINQAELLEVSGVRNKDTAKFARAAGAASADNIRVGSIIQALSFGAKSFSDSIKGYGTLSARAAPATGSSFKTGDISTSGWN